MAVIATLPISLGQKNGSLIKEKFMGRPPDGRAAEMGAVKPDGAIHLAEWREYDYTLNNKPATIELD